MPHNSKPVTILMADDDEEDCQNTKEALEENLLANEMYWGSTASSPSR